MLERHGMAWHLGAFDYKPFAFGGLLPTDLPMLSSGSPVSTLTHSFQNGNICFSLIDDHWKEFKWPKEYENLPYDTFPTCPP